MELTTLSELIGSLVDRGDREAIVAFQRDGVQKFSYAELARRVDLLALSLKEMGGTKGQRVAVLAPNQPNWMVAALGTIRAGAVVVPIDVQLPDEALKHVLRDAKPRVLFTVEAQEKRIRKLRIGLRTLRLLDEEPQEAAVGQTGEFPGVRRDDPAVLFFTSGTTGPPKGVPLTHRNVVHQLNVLMDIDLVQPEDRVLLPLPFHHVYPFVMGILAPLALGVPIVLPQALTGPQLTRATREGRVTAIIGVPRLYRALLDGIQREAKAAGRLSAAAFRAVLALSTFARRRLGLRIGRHLLARVRKRIGPEIRVVTSGGAALRPEVAYQLEALGWQVATGYGLTETAPLLTINYPAPGASRLDSAGKPIAGVELRIDPAAQPGGKAENRGSGRASLLASRLGGSLALPFGQRGAERRSQPLSRVEGEVLARGPNVFAGYHNLPEKNQEAFTEDGWFRTGDLGWIDRDGFLHLTGRVSTMIVTEGGKHVQPDDVEEAYQAHPAIREIGVFQKEAPTRLVAVIVPQRTGVAGNGEDVDAAVRQALEEQGRRLRPYERIAEYAMTSESLPKTRMGKIQHHLLEELYERAKAGETEKGQAGPISTEEMSGEDQELLRDPAAQAIWEWLVERFPDARLTPESSLRTDLQVDSMEWLNLTLEIGRRAGMELDEEAIGRIETVRDLLAEVAAASKSDGAQLEEALKEPEDYLDDEQRRWLTPLRPAQAVLAHMLYSMNRALMRLVFRVKAVGLVRLPTEGHYVIAPNHVSYLDSFVIAAVLDYDRLRRTYWGGWTGAAFRGPLTRWFSRLARVVPIDPDRAVLSSLALAAAVLKRGDHLVWFPEGGRSPDGQLQPLRPGIGIVLEHQPAIVVPAFIEGTYEAMPRGTFLPLPYSVRVTFGEAVESDVLEGESEAGERHERITAALQTRLELLAQRAFRQPVAASTSLIVNKAAKA